MKKIAIPFEGDHFPEESLELVRRLNEISPVWLTAAFVPEVDYSALWSIGGGLAGATYVPTVLDEDDIIAKNSVRLEAFCRAHSIKLTIHKDRLEFALQLIRKESRFSDLMVFSSQHFFDNLGSRQPNTYMKDILHTAECPVLLLPEAFQLPKNIIMAYDGTAASVHAIKEFAHLFPEFSGTPVTLVYLSESGDALFPDQDRIEELASNYFSDLHLLKLRMDHQGFFFTWLPAQEDPWLVTGSFGRSEMSQLFSKSFIASLIRDHKITVFTAH